MKTMKGATKIRGATVQVNCLCCKKEFTARVADRKRGWARYCSKSCKATQQEATTGQYANYLRDTWFAEHDFDDYDPSWDAHKDWR